MVITLDELVDRLRSFSKPGDATPSDALWIRFGTGKTHRTVDYRTSSENEIVHVYLDQNDSLVGIEIFP
jgi:hypothetical protein